MVSPDPDSGQGEILSQNLEEGAADGPVVASNCASDAADAGPFLVHHDRFGWREDRDLGGDAVQTLQLRLLPSSHNMYKSDAFPGRHIFGLPRILALLYPKNVLNPPTPDQAIICADEDTDSDSSSSGGGGGGGDLEMKMRS